MTTTVMNHSKVGDAWIREACLANPVQFINDANGNPTQNISSGPVRLAFCDPLTTPRVPQNNPQGKPKYGTMALYTPFTDFSIFYAEYYRLCAAVFPEYYVAQYQQYSGLHSPFNDQANKLKYHGFTPGLTYMNHTSNFKTQIVDVNSNPIVDPARIYPGVWAILALNAYAYGKSPPQPKKGVAFGLQGVMIIGDDEMLAGGGIDPRVAFQGVNVKPPAVAPGALMNMAGGQGQPPQPGAMQPPPGAPPGAGVGAAPGFQMPPPPRGTGDDDLAALR